MKKKKRDEHSHHWVVKSKKHFQNPLCNWRYKNSEPIQDEITTNQFFI